jgi:2,5-dioxopentanoate dehydrogenase
VGFTGSRAGGLALMKIASERPEPIPVYAEMSSINPVLLLPAALAARAEALGREFVGSLTLGVGQFCTNPGVIIAQEGADLDRFIASASATLRDVAPAVMLTPVIHDSYERELTKLVAHEVVTTVARGADSSGKNCGRAALLSVAARDVIAQPHLLTEVFGPTSLVVHCASQAQIVEVLERLEGQLTATLHFDSDDAALVAGLLPILERKAGRLIANGWPTGVEVAHAMVHGGPFPATSDGRSSSVGTLAIERFLRPVCYQDFPDALLPAALRRAGRADRPCRFDGAYVAAVQKSHP